MLGFSLAKMGQFFIVIVAVGVSWYVLKAQRSHKIPSRRQASRGLANGNAQIVFSHTSESIGAVRWSGTTILDIAGTVRDNAMFAKTCVYQHLWNVLVRILASKMAVFCCPGGLRGVRWASFLLPGR